MYDKLQLLSLLTDLYTATRKGDSGAIEDAMYAFGDHTQDCQPVYVSYWERDCDGASGGGVRMFEFPWVAELWLEAFKQGAEGPCGASYITQEEYNSYLHREDDDI